MLDILGSSVIQEDHGYVTGSHLIVCSFIYKTVYTVLNTLGVVLGKSKGGKKWESRNDQGFSDMVPLWHE